MKAIQGEETPFRKRGLRRTGLGAAVLSAVIALAVAGCGGSGSSNTTAKSNPSSSTTSSTTSTAPAAGNAASAVSSQLAKFEKPLAQYDLPSTKLKDVSKLKGKTIFYVPVASVVPEFAITAATMKTAVASVGAKLDVCSDPSGTPSEWNACVGQAISEHVAAIVLDAAPWQVVANQLEVAQKKGIKVIIADQQPSSKFYKAGQNAFMLGVSGTMQTAAADWIINDSHGKANSLIVQDTDGPSPPWYIHAFAIPEFSKYAPDAKNTIQTISTANQSQLSSNISSALLKDSSINYVYTEFDQFLQNAQQGVQSANASSRIKGVSTTALLAGLQALKSNNYLYADAGDDYPYEAYAIADLSYRLILGMPAVNENIPMRLFTRQNVGTVQLTTAAQNDGSWYGPTNYPTLWKKLWGVS
jgi:ribose transport system substrate-binding protein